MQLMSIQVGLPVEVTCGQRPLRTGIFKRAVEGPVAVRRCNLAGDGQADLDNHGGPHKAVYAYALEHYAFWQRELGRATLEHGAFGENLTIAGLDEAQLCIGDTLEIGSARFSISQPRVPCFKLGLRLGGSQRAAAVRAVLALRRLSASAARGSACRRRSGAAGRARPAPVDDPQPVCGLPQADRPGGAAAPGRSAGNACLVASVARADRPAAAARRPR
jgi:hypothetical protein